MNQIAAGSVSGLVATAPMTVVMRLLHQQLPASERYALPPKQITRRLADEVGQEDHLAPGAEWDAPTYAGHFGYGLATGAAYGALAPRVPGPPLLKGVVFGLGVWTVSYLGWLPAAGILPPATRAPARRNALMIGAHIVWGAATGLLTHSLAKRGSHGA